MASTATGTRVALNPLDRVERLALRRDWLVDRAADDEVNIIVPGTWSDLQVSLNWHGELEGLHLACSFDVKIPQNRRDEVVRLLSLINEQLYFGHFDLWRTDGTILFRNGLTLAGGAQASEAQCDALIRMGLDACDLYYPALQFVVWGGKSAEEAIAAAMLETVGEA